jgi:hypothetical protein
MDYAMANLAAAGSYPWRNPFLQTTHECSHGAVLKGIGQFNHER